MRRERSGQICCNVFEGRGGNKGDGSGLSEPLGGGQAVVACTKMEQLGVVVPLSCWMF